MYKCYALLAFIVGIIIISWAPVSASESYYYSIMHISDTQTLTEHYPSTLNFTFSYLESIKSGYNISAIIITGDLVDNGDDINQWNNYTSARSLTTIPLYEIPGNHDLEMPIGCEPFYDEFVGNPSTWSAIINDFIFIGIGYREEPLSDSDISYYTSVIEANPQKFTVIAAHNYYDRDYTMSTLGESIKDNLVLKPTIVMMGHVHGTLLRSGLVNNTSYIEDLTDYQDYGNFSAGKLYTIYVIDGNITKITVRDFYMFPLLFVSPERTIYPNLESASIRQGLVEKIVRIICFIDQSRRSSWVQIPSLACSSPLFFRSLSTGQRQQAGTADQR